MGSIHHDDNNNDDEESLYKTHPQQQQQQHSQQEEDLSCSSTQLLITTTTSPSSSSSPCPASTSSSEDDEDDEEEELGRRIPMLPRRQRFEPLHSQFQTAERRRPRQWNHSPFQQQQQGRTAPLFLPLFGSVPSLSPHGGGTTTTTTKEAPPPLRQQYKLRRELLLLQLVGCLTMALVLGRGLRVLWSSSEKPPSWNLAPLELVVPVSNERLQGRPLWDYLQPTLRQTVGTTNTEYIVYLRSNQHHTAWTWTETVQSYLTCPHLVELWIDDPTNANDASSVVLPNRVWNHPAVRFTPTITTNDWKSHPPPQQEEEERPSALFVVDPSRRYSCHELDRAIQEWKRDPTRLVGLEPPVWYQQAPQDDDESSSSLSWSYSLVSDKALLLHSRIFQLLKLAEQPDHPPDEAAATRRAQTRAAVECREYRWSAQWAAVSQQAPTALMTMSTVQHHHQQHDDDKSWCHTQLLEATHQTSFPSNQVLYTGRQVQSY